MATSCAQAIAKWKEANSAEPAEAVDVRLYCQVPPISKMDAALNQLVNCEILSLSTNMIDRLVSLGGMRKLRVLSIGRNQIKKLERLDDVAETLEELWCSYNLISSLDGLASLQKLTTLYMANNNLANFSELAKLAPLPALSDVLFFGNPMYEGRTEEEQRLQVLTFLPDVMKIDGKVVAASERRAAEALAQRGA